MKIKIKVSNFEFEFSIGYKLIIYIVKEILAVFLYKKILL